jgi:hypothetical protein
VVDRLSEPPSRTRQERVQHSPPPRLPRGGDRLRSATAGTSCRHFGTPARRSIGNRLRHPRSLSECHLLRATTKWEKCLVTKVRRIPWADSAGRKRRPAVALETPERESSTGGANATLSVASTLGPSIRAGVSGHGPAYGRPTASSAAQRTSRRRS